MRWSTSEARLSRLGGFVRLTHPFPSALDGLVTVAVAMIAGGDPATAVRLGLSMTALQAAIGILNDIVDAPRDGDRIPPKPIPAGLVDVGAARIAAFVAAAIGLALAVPSGIATVVVALIVLAIGSAYDLVAKGTAWSWLPFAVGIPVLPVFAWIGATGTIAPFFVILLPAGILAGTGLAIANALADLERDEAAGTVSVATRLGRERAWAVHAVVLAVVVLVAWATLAAARPSGGILLAAVLAGGGLLVGVGLARAGRRMRRERAWELEAVAVGVLAAAWLAGAAGQPA